MQRRPAGRLDQSVALGSYVKLMRAAESVTTRVHTTLPPEVTETQFAVLEALLHRGPMYHGEIATKVLKSAGNLTLVVKNLEKAGWVKRERQSNDQRFVKVHLTSAGQRVIKNLFPKVASTIAHEFSVLSKTEQDTLGRLCKKLGLGQQG